MGHRQASLGTPVPRTSTFWQTSIWHGGTVGRSVKMMFSSKAEERVDKKDMVRDVFMC